MILVPLLTGRFRLSQHRAHGTSLAVVGATAVSSLVVYGARSSVAWEVALPVGVASIFTVRIGARLANRLSSAALTRAFSIFLVVVALRLLWHPQSGTAFGRPSGLASTGLGVGIGASAGLLAGFMGVGGGIIAVPAFTLLLGMSQRIAQGTSLAMILATAPVGTIENSRHGNVAWPLVPTLAVGAAVGGPLAAWCAHLIPQTILARGFAVFLVASAVHAWVRAGGRGSAESARKTTG